MPELPEVETIKRGLDATIIGQQIATIEVLQSKLFVGDPAVLFGAVVENVTRRGKLLIIDVGFSLRSKNNEDGKYSILIHLKMTGQLIFKSKTLEAFGGGHPIPPLNTPVPNKSTKVIFTFKSGDLLYFNDIRTFGYVKAVKRDDVGKESFVKSLGIEPFDPAFTPEKFASLLDLRPKMGIKAFLLDQKYIAGLGNIYSDESLFYAGILPTRLVGSLNERERQKLYDSVLMVLEKGIAHHGASKSSYVNLEGKQGTFLADVAVYQRKGQPCMQCGAPIQKSVVAGRGTHFCANCQH